MSVIFGNLSPIQRMVSEKFSSKNSKFLQRMYAENLKKAGERVHLKKFVVASAEDMSCSSGKPGVEDNSVAAVVCTMVLCSLTDDQTTKTLAEVKRVLIPVSTLIALAFPHPPPPRGITQRSLIRGGSCPVVQTLSILIHHFG